MKSYHLRELNLKNSFMDEPIDIKNSLIDLKVDDSCLQFTSIEDKHDILCFLKCISLSVIFCK